MTSSSLVSRFAPSDDRPALGSHLVIRRVVQMGEVTWVVKNPETDKYYNFNDAEWGVIELFDGTRTREEIRDEYNRRLQSAGIDLQFILEYEEMLRNIEMLEQRGVRRHLALVEKFKTARKRAADERAEGFNPFFLLFKVFDPNRVLDSTVRYVRWIWTPRTFAISSLFFLFTIVVFIANWQPIWAGTIELYSFLKKPLIDAIEFFCILTVIGAIHEFGHGYATKIYGGEVHHMGIALLYFTPAFYCDTTDSLLFQNKWHRLWVTTAGMYIEAFICSAATITWLLAYPDTVLHDLAYKTMLFTGISTIFFNINPLVKIDGYYALTSVLEIPELREESFRYLGTLFQRQVLRLNVEVPLVARRKRRIYWIYGALALAYIGSIMTFIGRLFFNFYSHYFPNAAVVLLIVTLYFIFRKRVRLFLRISRLFILDKKELLMSRRMRKPLIAVAAAVLLFIALPWPRRMIRADAVLRPATTVQLQAPADGIIRTVRVAEGDRVRQRDVVVALSNPQIESRVASLTSERGMFAGEARTYRQAAAPAELFAAEWRESAAARSLSKEDTAHQNLEVRSPIPGVILTRDLQDARGRFVRAGSVIAEVGDCRTMRAELQVSERLLGDLFLGAPVSLQLRAQPWRTIRGAIVSIAPSTSASSQVAVRNQGLRPADEPEKFVAVAIFDNPDGILAPEMMGNAKIYGRRSSYVVQVWRGARRWVQSMFW
jgi:putative peptide zinc metalloprotease protein